MRTRSKGSLLTLGIALVALGALFGSASASAATQHWYGYAGGTPLAEGTPTEVVAEDALGVTIKYSYAGVELHIRCNSTSAGGSIENPSGGGSGTLSGVVLTLEECHVDKPAGKCTIPSTLETVELKGEATKFEGVPAIKYSPKSGTILTTFNVTGSECPVMVKGEKYIAGSFTAKYAGFGRWYEVTVASSAGLNWAGQPVYMQTLYELNSKSEEAVALVSDTHTGEHWYLGGEPAEGGKTKFAEGAAVGYSSVNGSMTTTLSASAGGSSFAILCGSGSGIEGSVENPSGGGAGSATGTVTFAGCTTTVNGKAGVCSVQGGGATSNPLSGLTTESGGAPAVSLSPAEKTSLTTFVVTGAECPAAFKGTKVVNGSLTGVPDSLGTYALSGTGVKYGALPATLSGQTTLETSAGERLGIAP